jgi:hypothetical protein
VSIPSHEPDPTGPPTVPPQRPRLVQPLSGHPRDPTGPAPASHPGTDTGTRRPAGRRTGPPQVTPRPNPRPDPRPDIEPDTGADTRPDRKDATTNTRPDNHPDNEADPPPGTGADTAPDTRPDITPAPTGPGADTPPDNPPDTPPDTDADSKGQNSQASRLVALAIGRYNLVNGGDGRFYAVDRDGPNVALPLRGRDGLRQRLARTYYRQTGVTPGGSALSDALQVIEGMAADSPVVPVGLRVARHDRSIVVDLADAAGHAVVISPGHWRVVDLSPVLFRRTVLTAPMPTPTAPGTGTLAGLRELLNVDDAGFRLIVAWLVAALVPDIPHPILLLYGEQGTAKSTAAKLAVRLVDPSPAPLRTPPKDIRAWSVTASASWTVALDNLSTIAQWFSDTLCKAVTGDGIVDRALFTDDDVSVISFRRVIAITAIDTGGLAGDLAERTIPVELQPIPEEGRRTEEEVETAYAAASPATLAALLDLTAAVLAALPRVRVDRLPRMADFARILAALDTVTGWATLPAYLALGAETNRAVLDADPFATAVLDLIAGQAVGWTGTAAELLACVTAPEIPPKTWPRSAKQVAGQLKRISPALRSAGVTITRQRTETRRLITLTPPPK